MNELNLLLDLEFDGLPPTVNHMYRGARGWRYLTPETREFQERTTALLKNAWRDKPPFTEPAALFITFYTNNKRRWDVDNRIKPLQDCLEKAGVILNDTQIDIILAKRVICKKKATRIVLRKCTLN